MVVSNRNLLFQGSMFRGYVSFREGILDIWTKKNTLQQLSYIIGLTKFGRVKNWNADTDWSSMSSWLSIYPWQIPWFWTAREGYILHPQAMAAHVSCRQDSITLIHNFGAIHRPSSKQLPAEGFAANRYAAGETGTGNPTSMKRQEGNPKRDLSSEASVAIHDLLILKALMVIWMNSPHRWAHPKGREQHKCWSRYCMQMLFRGDSSCCNSMTHIRDKFAGPRSSFSPLQGGPRIQL